MMRKIIYEEGNLILDDGITFGRGVFETILIYNNRLILLDYHLDRLNNSIAKMKIGDRITMEEIITLVSKIDLRYNIVLKILVTRSNIILSTRNIPYTKEDYISGFKIKLSSVIRNSTSMLTYLKSINYIENIIENEKAKSEGYNEVIFLNENNLLTEGSTSNIFIVKDNIIYTPEIKSGILPGVIRRWVLENFNVIESKIPLNMLLEADEIFITNSVIGIMRVYKFEKKEYNQNNKTNEVIKKYKDLLGIVGGSY